MSEVPSPLDNNNPEDLYNIEPDPTPFGVEDILDIVQSPEDLEKNRIHEQERTDKIYNVEPPAFEEVKPTEKPVFTPVPEPPAEAPPAASIVTPREDEINGILGRTTGDELLKNTPQLEGGIYAPKTRGESIVNEGLGLAGGIATGEIGAEAIMGLLSAAAQPEGNINSYLVGGGGGSGGGGSGAAMQQMILNALNKAGNIKSRL